MPLQSRLEIEENLADGYCILKQGMDDSQSKKCITPIFIVPLYRKRFAIHYNATLFLYKASLKKKKQKLIIQELALQKTELIIRTYLQ